MASQYDIIIPQFDGSSDWNERLVSVARGGILTATADANRNLRWLSGGTVGQILQIDASGDLVWATLGAGHDQNTDVGTTSASFYLNTSGIKIKDNSGVLEARNNADNAYANFKALGITLGTGGTVNTIETAITDDDTHIPTSGAVVDYIGTALAAADAMIFKGTVGSGGTHEIVAFNSLATYNAGWTYKIITAGTVKGNSCEVGDMIIATVDRAGLGNLNTDWVVVQANLDGAVIGPSSATDRAVAIFNSTTGKLIQNSSVTIDGSGSVNIQLGQKYKINNVDLSAADVGAASAYVTAPANWNSVGTTGQVAWDGDYLYRCVATNSWRRVAMSKWS